MTTFAEKFELTFRRLLPSPFAIAIILTFIAFIAAWLSTCPPNTSLGSYAIELTSVWQNGLWESSLLAFTVQMMLILVLGHTLALSKPISSFINKVSERINNGTQAALVVGILTMLVAFINWGLGLIFGAVLARKIGEMAYSKRMPISYPLIGAAGYSGLMVWHGGLSGSAPLKANELGHLHQIAPKAIATPDHISLSETLFSPMNIYATLAILILGGITLALLSRIAPKSIPTGFVHNTQIEPDRKALIGAEILDHKKGISYLFGSIILLWAFYMAIQSNEAFSFLTPNFINFTLLGAILIFHGTLQKTLSAFDEAISGAAGILLQFPLYFGIMALVRDSGLITQISESLIAHSNSFTFPLITLFSSGLINIFVPSGGGQWAIQAPLLIEAAEAMRLPLGKSIMALAYGDQLTNMLQPFWALPLLGITKLKAREILPYSLVLMLVGTLVYTSALLLF